MKDFDYDSIPFGYYDLVYRERSGVQSKWHHTKFKFFAEAISSQEFILDVGCGPGTFLGNLDHSGPAIGIDLSQPQIDYAGAHYAKDGLTFLSFDGVRFPFEDEQFDVVTLIEVIEHLSPRVVSSILRESFRVLKPGGRLLVSTPNYGSLWPLLEKVVNRKAEVTYEQQHINRYKRRRLLEEVKASGYSDVSVRAYQLAAPFFAALSWELSDRVYRLERGLLSSRIGFLLFGCAYKLPEVESRIAGCDLSEIWGE